MAVAARVTSGSREKNNIKISSLRDNLSNSLLGIENTYETGVHKNEDGSVDRDSKVPGSCHLCFGDIESEALLFLLEQSGIYASAASSCSSGAQEPSHVLSAMGFSRELARGSLRLSLGYASAQSDVDKVLEILPESIERLRALGS
jgi:cysteine desulfurase